jgi:hypothetical protein
MANEVISYLEMCAREGTSLQRGMSLGLGGISSTDAPSQRLHPSHTSEVGAAYGSTSPTNATHPWLSARNYLTTTVHPSPISPTR